MDPFLFSDKNVEGLSCTRYIEMLSNTLNIRAEVSVSKYSCVCLQGGPGSSVGIATGYGLNGPGIKSRLRGEIFRTCPDRPWAPLSVLYNGYRVFSGIKSGRGVTLTPHPLLVPWSTKRVGLYLCFPYGPCGLYRASVPVQGCTLSLPIPLLPLWTVRPVQSLSACTRMHFTFTYTSTALTGRTACTEPQYLYKDTPYLYLYLYSPYGPYGL